MQARLEAQLNLKKAEIAQAIEVPIFPALILNEIKFKPFWR